MLRLFSLFALSLKCSECIVGYKRGHCIAVLAFVVFDFETCVAGGILVPGGTFLAAELPWEVSAARENPNWLQIDLYTHPSRRSAAKTIQYSHAYPVSYVGYWFCAYRRKQTTSHDATGGFPAK